MKKEFGIGILALVAVVGTAGIATAQDGPRGGFRGADFETLDRTGDGLLTAEDLSMAAEARFAEIDADGDGRVTEAEFIAATTARAGERAARMFERLDADGDGVLSRDVLEARGGGRGGMLERIIERFDTDNNGGLDAEEFETARSEMRERGGHGGRRWR